jgi:hypothetical protein
MNQDILERLVIDKCSGELSPDAAALLEAWLNREPGAKENAAKIEETLRLAKRALHEAEEPEVARPRFNRSRWLPLIAALAACFAAGLFFGGLVLRQSELPPAPESSPYYTALGWPSRPPFLPPPAEGPAPVAEAGFWSQRRWQASGPKWSPSQPLWEWTSPVREPQLRAQL